MNKPLITEEMVNRFLSWRLPDDFSPDCGISFKRIYNEQSPLGPATHEPTGTNLLTAAQARAMLQHVLWALPIAPAAAAAPGPVTQAWTHSIPMMQQSVLLSAIRGPDGLAKYGGGAKMLLRWLRRCVLLSAMDGKVLADPIEANGGSFTGPSLDGPDEEDHWSDRMQAHVNDYLRQIDALPHHFQMHFLHAAEIIGYKHPDAQIRLFWNRLYLRLVNDFHLWPETEEQMDSRLGDSRRGWLERADPATIA